MMFKPELVEQILAGTKTQTRRPMSVNPRSPWWEGGCTLNVEQDYAVCPGRGKPAAGRVRVTGIRRGTWADLSELDAIAEGFQAGMDPDGEFYRSARERFYQYTYRLYRDFDSEDKVWVVEFELIKEAGQ